MSGLVMLQNVSGQAGEPLIIEWPMDDPERFCQAAAGDPGSEIVIRGAKACWWHCPTMPDGSECDLAERTPPECQHLERSNLMCLICGLEGADVTERWGKQLLTPNAPDVVVPIPAAEDTEITTAPEDRP